MSVTDAVKARFHTHSLELGFGANMHALPHTVMLCQRAHMLAPSALGDRCRAGIMSDDDAKAGGTRYHASRGVQAAPQQVPAVAAKTSAA